MHSQTEIGAWGVWRGDLAMMALPARQLVGDEDGQDTAEYGIALATIGLVAGLAAILISANVGSVWSRANSVVQVAVDNP